MYATQSSMLEDSVDTGVSIESAAQRVNVSTATVRNWIKTGYLKAGSNGGVDGQSLEKFITQVVGQEKLTGRANKSQKDSHDHEELSSDFEKKITNLNLNIDSLVEEYEQSLSESFKNKEGIYYTPRDVVLDLLQLGDKSVAGMTFLDPCCGSGNFIVRAIELGFKPENIYGYDTDQTAVELTKRRILERTGYITQNIKHADFLAEALNPKRAFFDCIYTNPPWGKKLTKDEKEKYGLLLQSGKSVDTCSLFLFACMQCLREGGELGLLLPDSFYNIATFEAARIKVLSYDIKRLVDYEKPFKGLMTKAFAFTLTKRTTKNEAESILCESGGETYNRSSKSFTNNPKSIINFQCKTSAADVIDHAFSMPHITLSSRAKWGLGIVTGNNEKFSQSQPKEGYIPVFRGADIKKNELAAPTCFIPKNLSLYQQVAPIEFYEAPVKLIYKFISAKLCFFYDDEKRYILNSANMLIPKSNLPISAMQLCALLNSDFLNWLFSELFKTHKVLRGDLEMLPIYVNYFHENIEFHENLFLNFLSIQRLEDGSYCVKK